MMKIVIIILLNLLILNVTFAQEIDEEAELINQLKNLVLEELTEVRIFDPEAGLASRKVQRLTNTAAALFVITQEDIRRAGVTNLAEALRMVPGMQVARLDPHQWAISARGLNEQFASRLLVMVDGRTVYSPMRSEVNWDTQGMLMEDIDHIEVIRGPGASLWGANAVNGIINIITKSTKQTHGNLLTTHIGTSEEQAIVGIRNGGELENGMNYRIYGKFYDHAGFANQNGQNHDNDWIMKRTGLRADWEIFDSDNINLQANMYDGKTNASVINMQGLNGEAKMSGLNMLARWQHNLDNGDIVLQAYFDKTKRNEFSYDESRDTYDLDFQHRWQVNNYHELIWGLGFRYNSDNITTVLPLAYIPAKRKDKLFSAFVQSEFMLKPDKLRLTLGTKFEHNDYTGLEIQPTARLLWNINDSNITWMSISRAVRTPSRTDSDFLLDANLPGSRFVLKGNPDLDSEVLMAYELGYRFNIANKFLLDTSIFYNEYDNLRTTEMMSFQPFPPPPTVTNQFSNQMYGEVYGLELAAHWQASENLKLVATYSYLDTQLHISSTSTDTNVELVEGYSPEHQTSLRVLWTILPTIEFDTSVYYVDKLFKQDELLYYGDNFYTQNVSAYTRLDMRLGWQVSSDLNLSVGVRNLLDNQHSEFSFGERGAPVLINEVERTFYMQMKYLF